jgi:hypothetical protein
MRRNAGRGRRIENSYINRSGLKNASSSIGGTCFPLARNKLFKLDGFDPNGFADANSGKLAIV